MILWLFALFDLCMGLLHLFAHWNWLPWRALFTGSFLMGAKALVFNDHFLSFLDIASAVYLFLQIWFDSTFLSYFFAGYFGYKVLMSL